MRSTSFGWLLLAVLGTCGAVRAAESSAPPPEASTEAAAGASSSQQPSTTPAEGPSRAWEKEGSFTHQFKKGWWWKRDPQHRAIADYFTAVQRLLRDDLKDQNRKTPYWLQSSKLQVSKNSPFSLMRDDTGNVYIGQQYRDKSWTGAVWHKTVPRQPQQVSFGRITTQTYRATRTTDYMTVPVTDGVVVTFAEDSDSLRLASLSGLDHLTEAVTLKAPGEHMNSPKLKEMLDNFGGLMKMMQSGVNVDGVPYKLTHKRLAFSEKKEDELIESLAYDLLNKPKEQSHGFLQNSERTWHGGIDAEGKQHGWGYQRGDKERGLFHFEHGAKTDQTPPMKKRVAFGARRFRNFMWGAPRHTRAKHGDVWTGLRTVPDYMDAPAKEATVEEPTAEAEVKDKPSAE